MCRIDPTATMIAANVFWLLVVVGPADGGWECFVEFGTNPADIAVDSSHSVYVLDGDHRIQVYTTEGEFLREKTGLDYARSLAIDENDNVYVLNYLHEGYSRLGWVTRYTSDFQPLGSWQYAHSDIEMGFGIDVREGIAYIAAVHGVLKYTIEGDLLANFGGVDWREVCALPDGSVWCLNGSSPGWVRHYSDQGEVLATWNTILPGEQESYPRGLAIDSRGRIFVSDDGAVVKIFLPDGTFDERIQWQLRIFERLELDGDNTLYICTAFPDRVMEFRYEPEAVRPATWGGVKVRYR